MMSLSFLPKQLFITSRKSGFGTMPAPPAWSSGTLNEPGGCPASYSGSLRTSTKTAPSASWAWASWGDTHFTLTASSALRSGT